MPIEIDTPRTIRIRSAEGALATLDTAARASPNACALSDAALRREAVALAGMDGSTVALTDLLLFDAATPLPPARDMPPDRSHETGVIRASRYLDALNHGRRRVEKEGTLTGDILLDLVAQLGRQPIPAIVTVAVAGIDAWLRTEGARCSAVVRASATQQRLAPLQTAMEECGPLSRIAALLLLCSSDRPCLPLISPSVAWPGHAEGADDQTIAEGDGDDVAARFADHVLASATDSLSLIERITALAEEDARRIGALSKAAHSAHRVHLALQRRPVIALPRLLQETGLRVQAATSALHRLRALGIIREITGRHRHCVYSYDAYVELLNQDLV